MVIESGWCGGSASPSEREDVCQDLPSFPERGSTIHAGPPWSVTPVLAPTSQTPTAVVQADPDPSTPRPGACRIRGCASPVAFQNGRQAIWLPS
jgi:hypothetical protein